MSTLILAAVFVATVPQFEVQLLDGQPVSGSIAAMDDDKVTIETTDGPVVVDVGKLLRIVAAPPGKVLATETAVWVDLVDGSSVVGSDYSATEGRARITFADKQYAELSVERVAAVRFQTQTVTVAAEWSRILDMNNDSDVLVVRKGEAINYHGGLLGDVDRTTVQFNLDGDVLPVKRGKVLGVIYYHRDNVFLPQSVCSVSDTGGSRWVVSSLALSGDMMKLTTPAGLTVSRPLRQISQIDFSSGKVTYLSDLKPESVNWSPYFGNTDKLPALRKFFAPREDSSLASGKLRLGGKVYDKGLALHSRCELVYRLPARFSRFKATAGIDDSVRPHGNVRLVISGDDRTLLETTIDGTDPPKPIDLDVSGVRRLTILVDFGQRLDVADHLDLCEARIQ